jgi:sulfopyruvate decarboxylase subunit alpha
LAHYSKYCKGGCRVSEEKPIGGREILDAIALSGIEHVISVPDITTSEGLLWPLATDKRFRLIRVCKEDEGVSICAGLAFCDKKALLLIQYTGFLDSLNAIRAIACEYKLPICMMVGLLEKEPGVKPMQSNKFGVRILEPIMDTMGIEHDCFELASDVFRIRPAIDRAYANSSPVTLMLGRRMGKPS